MELFVFVLCLMCERFLVHVSKHPRFDWFLGYANRVVLSLHTSFSAPVILSCIILPILLCVILIFSVVGNVLFGLLGLVLNIIIFYYCIGPVNPFYSAHVAPAELLTDSDIGEYFTQANGQLFAVVFWYLMLGPVMVLAYRLISLAQRLASTHRLALKLINILDWLPARVSALLYLLVGNFQLGFRYYCKHFFTAPKANSVLLHHCGLAAIYADDHVKQTMLHAETLVEHATIVFLVLIALCTMAAWF